MITFVGVGDPRLGNAAGEALILTAIQALARTAGTGMRREFWVVTEDSAPRGSSPLGAVCRMENSVLATVAVEDAAQEAAAFLEMLGQLPATVDRRLVKFLPGEWERFPMLRYAGDFPEEEALCETSAMALVELGIAAGAVPPAARDELYAELHLRLRRGAAQIYLVPGKDGEPAAGACSLLGRTCAVIGYLACPPEKRGQGYGTAALLAAVRGAMKAGRVPVLACGEELVSFYIGRGFVRVGEVYERKDQER